MIDRRSFLKLGGAAALFAGLDLKSLLAGSPLTIDPASPFYEQLASDEFPFPYDTAVFDAAERIANVRRNSAEPKQWLTDLNLLVKPGKTLDVKVLVAERRQDLANPLESLSFTGVKTSFDTVLRGYDSPRLHYQIQYREGQGIWKAHPPRSFKLPNTSLTSGGQVQAILLGDDHTFDDADYSLPEAYRKTRITGDYFVDFLRGMRSDPKWYPDPPLDALKFSYLLIRGIYQVLANEDPDFFINMGDCNGIGSGYKWQNWGLPHQNLTDADFDYISRTLWLRIRKAFSGLTPNMPVFFVLGNHDGESSWDAARFRAREWRNKLFPLPTRTTYDEGGHPDGNYYGFTWGSDEKNCGGAQFLVLDSTGFVGDQPKKPEDWTLGTEQLGWLEDTMRRTDPEWRFACFHHVLGGWPSGSHEAENSYAYGRGPLFTAEDYQGLADPAKVEQVRLTEMGKTYGLRAFLYGHDHIYHARRIGAGINKKDLYGLVVGSTKHIGEFSWWQSPYWKRFYGDAAKATPEFFGPSGITRMTIKKDITQFDYFCTGYTPNTNLPSGGIVGTTYAVTVIDNPAPAIQVEMASIAFERNELATAPPPPQTMRIRNGGGQRLDFRVLTDQNWLKASPTTGTSCLAWAEISITAVAEGLAPGTYAGTALVEAAGLKTVRVSVQLVISPDPLFAPLKFKALRTPVNGITLAWQPNPGSVSVVKLRLYRLNDQGNRVLIVELDARKTIYQIRKADPNQSYRFALVAVNSRGREGEAALASV